MKSKLKKGFERLVRLLGRTEGLVFRLSWTTVNRDCFLQHTLGSYLSPSQMQQAITGSPLDVLTPEELRHFARKVIWKQSLLVSFFSVLLALPSERFLSLLLAAIDIVQFQVQVFIVAQKLLYLYGSHNLEENGRIRRHAATLLWVESMVMIGSSRVSRVLKSASGQAIRRAFSLFTVKSGARVLIVNTLRQGLKWCGLQVMRRTVVLWFVFFINIVCALISGLVTFWLFYPMAMNLYRHLSQCSMQELRVRMNRQ
jgi:hypothetical protein